VLQKIQAKHARLPAGHARIVLGPAGRSRSASTPPAARSAAPMGVDENEYLPAAKLGVTKINIDTDGRFVWTRVHREFFRDNPKEFDFRPPGKVFMDEYAKFIAHKNQKLGSAGQLEDLRASLKK
jgi:fructose-bisphosphate aldolase class II